MAKYIDVSELNVTGSDGDLKGGGGGGVTSGGGGEGGDTLSVTMDHLEKAFELLVTLLVGSLSDVPPQIKNVIQSIANEVGTKFGTEHQNTFVIGYFFLRYICPALAIPYVYFDINVPPKLKKICLLMSKMLQAATIAQESQSMEKMRFATEIIGRSRDKLQTFLYHLSVSDGQYGVTPEQIIYEETKAQYYQPCDPMPGRKVCGIDQVPDAPSVEECVTYFSKIFENDNVLIVMKSMGDGVTDADVTVVRAVSKEFELAERKNLKP